jgi:hypothetical protein
MDLQLKGKTAVITGATRGIGRAIAELFADEGADVAICARNEGQVAEAVKALQAKGVKAFGQAVDIADGPALKGFVNAAAEALGGLDILVSNASALVNGNTEETWKAMFDVDIMGAVRAFEAGKPHLEKAAAARGDACFLITSSISAAESDRPDAYGAMKAPDPLRQGPGAGERGQEDPLQRGLARYGVLRGRGVGKREAQCAGLLRDHDPAEPHGPHGDAAGHRQRHGVSGEPGIVVHHRHQHAGRRRDQPPRELLSEA